MTYAAYQYESDDGITYQVVLPSDFAGAFGYIAAVGTEPYLPASTSMRYATYVNTLQGLWISAYIMLPFAFATLPQTVAIGGTSYQLRSAIGEIRGTLPAQANTTIMGPQGPKGDTGATGATGATGPQGPSADIITVAASITQGQLNAIHTSPVAVIPASGTTQWIDVLRVAWKWNFGTTAYTGGGPLVLTLAGITLFTFGNLPAQTANTWGANNVNESNTTTNLENLQAFITASADWATGDGFLRYSIDYRYVP